MMFIDLRLLFVGLVVLSVGWVWLRIPALRTI